MCLTAAKTAAPNDDCGVARACHERALREGSSFKAKRSSLSGSVSSHVLPESISFGELRRYHKVAQSEGCGSKSFIGSISGDLVVSVNVKYAPPPASVASGRKRKADSVECDVTCALDRLVRSGGTDDAERPVSKASYKAAHDTMCALLRIKGTGGETMLESWAISLRQPGEYGAPTPPVRDGAVDGGGAVDHAPSIVLAVRLSAGTAISVEAIDEATRMCTDGMITVSAEQVNRAFDLPLTEQGRASQERGQRSILVLTAVPRLQDDKYITY